MEFIQKPDGRGNKNKNRNRKILWFNPPYSDSVKTNLGSKFLSLLDKHFKNSKYKKFFNRSTIKVSYCCMPNMESIISGHNRKILSKNSPTIAKTSLPQTPTHPATSNNNNNTIPISPKNCSCRNPSSCPLQGNCLTKNIVYKAEVKTDTETYIYLGLTSSTFKERYSNHIFSFRNQKCKDSTSLSKKIWELQTLNTTYSIDWRIVSLASAYNPCSGSCQLCLVEKAQILYSQDKNLLNQRTELMNKCRHRKKYLLSSI